LPGDAFAIRALDALCAYAARCPMNELGTFGDADACREALRTRRSSNDFGTLAALAREEAAGHVSVDESKAAACLAAIGAATCDGVLGAGALWKLEDCAGATAGRLTDGAACIADGACASGLCVSTGGCAGTCVASKGPGVPCDGDCRPGLFCAVKAGGAKVCQAAPGDGESCEGPCEPGLTCVRDRVMGTSECTVPPTSVDADCEAVRSCGAGLTCVDTSPPPICESNPGDGEQCLDFQFCAAGHVCDAANFPPVCRPVGDGSDDTRCGRDADCDEDLRCHGAPAGFCSPPRAIGAACEANGGVPCVAGAICSSGSCVQLPSTGPCLDLQCAAGFACLGETCGVPPGVGQPCPFGVCGAGAWCDRVNDQLVCIAYTPEVLPGVGSSCAASRRCEEGANCPRLEPQAGAIKCVRLPGKDAACADGRCAPGFACVTGTCRAPTVVTCEVAD